MKAHAQKSIADLVKDRHCVVIEDRKWKLIGETRGKNQITMSMYVSMVLFLLNQVKQRVLGCWI